MHQKQPQIEKDLSQEHIREHGQEQDLHQDQNTKKIHIDPGVITEDHILHLKQDMKDRGQHQKGNIIITAKKDQGQEVESLGQSQEVNVEGQCPETEDRKQEMKFINMTGESHQVKNQGLEAEGQCQKLSLQVPHIKCPKDCILEVKGQHQRGEGQDQSPDII